MYENWNRHNTGRRPEAPDFLLPMSPEAIRRERERLAAIHRDDPDWPPLTPAQIAGMALDPVDWRELGVPVDECGDPIGIG